MDASGLVGDLGMKGAMQGLDELMREQGVSKEVRAQIINASEMMYQYIPYCIEQRAKPTDGKVLAKFLADKGQRTLKMFGHDGVNCGLAIVSFLLATKKAAVATQTGAAPVIALAYGLALLDLIEVGNSCEFAQQAYYEAFIRENNTTVAPVKTMVDQYYSEEKRMCIGI